MHWRRVGACLATAIGAIMLRRYRAKQKKTLVRGHVVWTNRPLTPYSLHGAAGDGDDR
jgi:hypothetical protein